MKAALVLALLVVMAIAATTAEEGEREVRSPKSIITRVGQAINRIFHTAGGEVHVGGGEAGASGYVRRPGATIVN